MNFVVIVAVYKSYQGVCTCWLVHYVFLVYKTVLHTVYNCVTTYAFQKTVKVMVDRIFAGRKGSKKGRWRFLSARMVITTWWHVLLGEVWRTWIMKSSGNRSCKTFPLDLMFSCFAFCNTFRIYHLKSSWSIYFEMGILKFITVILPVVLTERPIPPIPLRRTMLLWFVDLGRRGPRTTSWERDRK